MLERLRQSGWSIQAQLLLYSSALLIPALIFSGLMILRSASLERTAMEDEITDVVRSLATAIDRELSATTTTLKALASSPALTEGDLKAFYNQATAARDVSGNDFILSDTNGKQLLSTRADGGGAEGASLDAKQILQAGTAYISNVHPASKLDGATPDSAATFNISVPVRRGERPIYVLSASISPERILEILQRAELDPGQAPSLRTRRTMMHRRGWRAARPGSLQGNLPCGAALDATACHSCARPPIRDSRVGSSRRAFRNPLQTSRSFDRGYSLLGWQ